MAKRCNDAAQPLILWYSMVVSGTFWNRYFTVLPYSEEHKENDNSTTLMVDDYIS